ncbi:hypothetical protein KNP414_07339 [Paenibacillus mucilaginosus KNP414]|uniref:Uncharacterized protein n=1 Tax=Paenibacillus mucilaginosus (strain KNP414) TaxID=1036673 RepID=F8FP67_PAEMK|nr:hypothetical protein KNP414_07339 [Paenibacillus mucilaginosus KNP414]
MVQEPLRYNPRRLFAFSTAGAGEHIGSWNAAYARGLQGKMKAERSEHLSFKQQYVYLIQTRRRYQPDDVHLSVL